MVKNPGEILFLYFSLGFIKTGFIETRFIETGSIETQNPRPRRKIKYFHCILFVHGYNNDADEGCDKNLDKSR